MELYGAKLSEVVGLINATSGEGWKKAGPMLWIVERLIVGCTLRVRETFHPKGLTKVALVGNGWMVSFDVTKRRPRSLPDAAWSTQASLVTPVQAYNKAQRPVSESREPISLSIHGGSVLSPEAFQKEMCLLRMFASEWET